MRSFTSFRPKWSSSSTWRACGDIERVLACFVPGQLQNVLEISPDDVVIRRAGRQLFEPRQFALGFLANLFRQLGLLQPLAQLLHFGLLAGFFAELLLDRAHLLAQQVVALLLIHFGAGFGVDLVPQLQHLNFMSQIGVHQAQSFSLRVSLEHGLLFL